MNNQPFGKCCEDLWEVIGLQQKRIAELDSLINSRVFPSMGDGFSGDYVCGYERALADMCRALKEQNND